MIQKRDGEIEGMEVLVSRIELNHRSGKNRTTKIDAPRSTASMFIPRSKGVAKSSNSQE